MIFRRPTSVRSLIEQAAFIAEDSPMAGERFLLATERAFAALSRTPRMGRVWTSSESRLRGVRVWPVPGFRSHLIFYRESTAGIEILDLIHGARRIEELLGG